MHLPDRFTRTRAGLRAAALTLVMTVSGLVHAAELDHLVAAGAQPEKLLGDCRFTEGPAYSPHGFLLFSDIPNSRVIKVLPDGSSSDFLKPSGRANGLMFDAAGILYACQGGAKRVVRIDPARPESVTILAHSYGGKPFNSPNDLALDRHGGLYFTDPHYGPPAERTQDVMAVYYIGADMKLSRVIDDMRRPNGILVSADGRHLYVAEIDLRQLLRYEITAPGKLGAKEVLFTGDESLDGGGPDGMTLDAAGNLYATYRSLVVLDPEGRLLGRIPVPEKPANCAFGGEDQKTLYITARTSLYSLRMNVAGRKLEASGPRPARATTREVAARGLRLDVPVNWKEEATTSSMRLAQFDVPPAPGDKEGAELVIYYFPGGGGGVEPNLRRWIGQFTPDGRTVRITKGRAARGTYHLADIAGTYNQPIGPPIQRRSRPVPGSRVLAAILEAEDGIYYLKMAGPDETVSSAAESFRGAFGADETAEEPFTLGGDS